MIAGPALEHRNGSMAPAALVAGGVLALSVAAFFRVPLLPEIGRDLGMSASGLATITTVFAIGRLLTDLPAGRIADEVPALRGLAIAGGLLAFSSAVMAVAPAGVWVISAALFLGIASALTNTTGMTYFSRSSDTARRGTALAWFSAALLGGQAFGPTAGGLIGGIGGWRVALGVGAGLGLVFAIVLRLLPPDEVPGRDGDDAEAGGEVTIQLDAAGRAALYAVPFACFYALGAMPQTLVPIIGDTAYGLTASTIGLFLGLGGACRFVGVMIGGRVADQVSRKVSLVPGLVLFGIGVGILAVNGGLWTWVAAIVLMSLGSYGISVAATILGDVTRGRTVGRRLGAFRFVPGGDRSKASPRARPAKPNLGQIGRRWQGRRYAACSQAARSALVQRR